MKKIIFFIVSLLTAFSLFFTTKINALAPNEPSMVNVHFYGDVTTTRGITWSTLNNTKSHVQVVLKEGDLPDFSKSRLYVGKVSELTMKPKNKPLTHEYIHQVVIDELLPNNKYFYRVGDKDINVWSEHGVIETPVKDINEFTFFHMSDVQSPSKSGIERFMSVLDEAYKLYPKSKFIAFTGDYVENSDYREQWEWAFDMPKKYLMNTTFASASGNHDMFNHVFSKRFYTNHPEGIDTTNGTYYSFTYGNAHFSVLDTNDTTPTGGMNQKQLEWLENDLKNDNSLWKFVMFHKGIYTTGYKINHDKEIRIMRKQLVPLMMKYGVDIVLQGHDHLYIRTKPQKLDGEGYDTPEIITEYHQDKKIDYMVDPDGIIYINSNTAGGATFYQEIEYDTTHIHPFISGQPEKQMFSAITIKNNKLFFNAYTVEENDIPNQPDIVNLFDSFNLKKALHFDLITSINELKNLNNLTVNDYDKIQNLLSDYNQLPETSKTLVDNYNILLEANEIVKEKMRQEALKGIVLESKPNWSAISIIIVMSVMLVVTTTLLVFYVCKRKKVRK